MTDRTGVGTPRAGRREWIGLAVLSLACVLYVMDLTVLHLAVPQLSADLQPTSAQLLWIVDIYGFVVAGALITMGTLGDRIGRRRLLMIGAGAFGLVSVVAAFSTSAEMLIVSRALMGLAGATLAPSTLSLIFSMFLDPRQRSVAIAVWVSSFSAGSAIGPLLGGIMLEYFWWGSVFLLALPVMALLLVLGPRLLPEYRDPEAGRVDLPSAAMSLSAILAVVYGLKGIAQDGFRPEMGLAIVAGLIVGFLFLRRQQTLADPFIDLQLFRIPAFSASLVTYMMGLFVSVGYFLFVAQYLQLIEGLSPLQAGLWSLPSAVAFIVSSNLAPRVARRFHPAWVMGTGLGIAALGLAMILLVDGSNDLAILVTASIVTSLSLAPVVTLATELVVGSAPPERAGTASGISETSAELGASLGVALLGSIGTAVYRGAVASALPADVPSEAAKAALGTLGGATGVAEQLPAGVGLALLEVAQQAFVQGLHAVVGISAVAAIGAAIVAVLMLRGLPVRQASEQPPELDQSLAQVG